MISQDQGERTETEKPPGSPLRHTLTGLASRGEISALVH